MKMNYHYRQNIFLWYNFKYNSTLLELNAKDGIITNLLSKKVKSIYVCNTTNKFKQKDKNITIIDDIIDRKFDYIVISDLDEYLNYKNINITTLFDKLTKVISKDTIILFNIKNKYSFKNFCGDLDDDNVLYYNDKYTIYSKNELEILFKIYKFNYKFYYPFPNSNMTEILLTDEHLNKNTYINYLPVHYKSKNFFMDELEFYKMSFYDKTLPIFSNDYLIELRGNKINTKISFIKFNNYRKPIYNLYTYCLNNKYYKSPICKEGLPFLNEYKESFKEMNKLGIKTIEIKEDKNGIYTDEIICDSMLNKIINEYSQKGEIAIEENLKKYKKYLETIFSKNQIKYDSKNNIFFKYNINLKDENIDKLHFVDKAYVDIIPQNMLIKDSDYYLIDQEWSMENVPYEYILYRGILSVVMHFDDIDIKMRKYFEMFSILEYFSIFQQLEEKFYTNIECDEYRKIKKYHEFNLLNTRSILKNAGKYDKELKEKNEQIKLLNEKMNDILNSKSWKITKPLRFFMEKLKRK